MRFAAVALVVFVLPQAAAAATTVAFWHMNETSGSTMTDSK